MPGMRDIKRRIKSIQSTQKITKAMKMVAAAKLRRAQEKVTAARPYSGKLQEVLKRLVGGGEDYSHPLLDVSEPSSKVGYVVVTADRGFCGGYNANVIRLTEATMRESGHESVLIAVGKKGRDYFRRRGYSIVREYLELGDDPNYIQARELARELAQYYLSGEAQELHLVYTRFYSAIRQQPVIERLLPVAGAAGEEEPADIEYIYEPSAAEVLNTLLPRYLETIIYKALLEAKASELGARMTAMDAASDNAGEMIQKLTLSFNRARQAAITREITEIVGGAAALE